MKEGKVFWLIISIFVIIYAIRWAPTGLNFYELFMTVICSLYIIIVLIEQWKKKWRKKIINENKKG